MSNRLKTLNTDPSGDFLLEGDFARELYHGHAESCPIVDFHNHLPIKDICENRQYPDIGTLWVCSDPYKHRAMRLMGLPERVISGDASPREKLDAWYGVLPQLICNPLYHWSFLEMKRFFGLDLWEEHVSAGELWDHCNALLQKEDFTINSLLKKVHVTRASTSDDLLDDVRLHKKATEVSGINVTPSLRGDSIIGFQPSWMERLQAADNSLEAFLDAVSKRLDAFGENGCKLSDHALDNGFAFKKTGKERAAGLFGRLGSLNILESIELKSFILEWLAREYARRGWVMQLHIGAERWTSSRLRATAGAAGGFACPGSGCDIRSICDFLDAVDADGQMPKVILYTLNPADNAPLATMTGSFSESGVQKIKFGPAWWFNDHQAGIEENLEVLSSYSLLSQAIGMTTDSRNVLSFSRHEYFRRILCNYLGKKVDKGLLPKDPVLLGTIVENICYANAEKWIYE